MPQNISQEDYLRMHGLMGGSSPRSAPVQFPQQMGLADLARQLQQAKPLPSRPLSMMQGSLAPNIASLEGLRAALAQGGY